MGEFYSLRDPPLASTFESTTLGPMRRSTAEVLERLSQAAGTVTENSPWYEPSRDFYFYSAAENKRRLAEARFKRLKLTPEERQTIKTADSLHVVLQRMKSVQYEHEIVTEISPETFELSRLVNGLYDLTVKLSGIVDILFLQSPEYAITYRLIMVIFKAVVDGKKEKLAPLSGFLEKVATELPQIEFYESVFPTNAMKVTVAAIYTEIMTFLDNAARYYCSGRLVKLIDAVLQPIESEFDECLGRIKWEVRKLIDLKDSANVVQQNDMRNVLEVTDQGKAIVTARLYENFEGAVSAIGSSVALLNRKMELMQTNQDYITSFQAKSYVQALRQAVFPNVVDADEELERLVQKGFRFSPAEHWENNGVLDSILSWSRPELKCLLWVGGRPDNRSSWITELSVDLVRALETQDKTVVFVFCYETLHEALTPTTLVRRLIVQILEAYPLLAFQNPERLNSRRLKKAETFEQLWSIWQFLTEQVTELFIIIDRIDQCALDDKYSISRVLLPRFFQMLKSSPQVSVIITSFDDPPPELQDDRMLYAICINTEVQHTEDDQN